MSDNATRPQPGSPFMAGWGVAGFVLFLLSLATAEYKYVCALASVVLMAWAYRSGPGLFPAAARAAAAPLATWLPLAIGTLPLAVLALAPLLTGDLRKYLAFVQALTGIRI